MTAAEARALSAGLDHDTTEPDLIGPFPPVPTEAQIDALLADARRAADAAGTPPAEELPADSPALAALRAAEERVLWMLERFATRSGPMLIEWEQLREVADLLGEAMAEMEVTK